MANNDLQNITKKTNDRATRTIINIDSVVTYTSVSDLPQVTWFSSGTSVSSTTKTDHNDMTEILLQVVYNTISQPNHTKCRLLYNLKQIIKRFIRNLKKNCDCKILFYFYFWNYCIQCINEGIFMVLRFPPPLKLATTI
jgi:hypothetical protein